jgi:hypothetical protein
MRTRRALAILLAVCLLAAIAVFVFHKSASPPAAEAVSNPGTPESNATPGMVSSVAQSPVPITPAASPRPEALANILAPPATNPAATPLPVGPPPTEPEPGAPPALSGATAVEAVRSAIQKYGAMFGGNPVGTNAEITQALNGNNPSHALFLSGIPGQQINSNGEMVDPWGTPYFFHQLSGSDMEVRSAGPDRKMWTSDDIVIK